ncbi:MAG: rhodanese-like domain-containing protein, partial [Rhodoferax sp.]|nr:rhodanese-like domain-containing protein [Rhodoferax sp.]
ASGSGPVLLDVRREPVYRASTEAITQAKWYDPSEVAVWGRDFVNGPEVVVYCVHGHQVSQGCADALANLGVTARYLDGGIEGWKEIGEAVVTKTEGES